MVLTILYQVAKFLLESKAKANTRDKNGWSAAVWALAMGHLRVLQVLANFGVSTRSIKHTFEVYKFYIILVAAWDESL